MRKRTVLAMVVFAGLAVGAGQGRAQEDRGAWNAASSSAETVTGAVTIYKDRVAIDLLLYPLAEIRRLKPVEVSAVFDADVNAGIEGTLYRLNVAPGQRFQHKNTLCGDEAAQWMATYVTGKRMQVAFFSGDDIPVFTFDAISKSTNVCGTFVYSR